MPYFELSKEEINFPPAYFSDIDGLVAVGGDLSVKRLILAYNSAIYFWNHPLKHIKWWSPDPRIILKLHDFEFPFQRFQNLQKEFNVTFDTSLDKILEACKNIYNQKEDMNNNWLTENAARSFLKLQQMGLVKSVAIWIGNELVGGLFGIVIGKIFFGEYLFSMAENADEFALLNLVKLLKNEEFEIADLQKETMLFTDFEYDEMSRLEYISLCQENAKKMY